MKTGKSLSFTRRIFSVLLLSGIFRRRAALSGATFAKFCIAAQRGAARHGAVSGGAVVHAIVSIKKNEMNQALGHFCAHIG